jgi:Zn-dependent protease
MLPLYLIEILCFVPAIVIHEVSHGFAAYKMGDTTAKEAHRLSLNPVQHIDPFGTVILPLALMLLRMPIFGYAKPVPYNPNNFKNIRVGEVVTGLAGPASNIIMALIGGVLGFIGMQIFDFAPAAMQWVMTWIYYFILINLALAFFNLLPIPPLDGSSIIMPFIPQKHLGTWYQIQRYALPVLIILVIVLPYIGDMVGLNLNPLWAYIDFTAGNLSRLLFPY